MNYPRNENWGVPDWMSKDAYGPTDAWSDNRWRWEFTRRREDYRNDFDNTADHTYEVLLEVYGASRPIDLGDGNVLKPTEAGFVAGTTKALKYDLLGGMPNPRISDQPSHCIQFSSLGLHFYKGEGKPFLEGDTAIEVPVPEGWIAAILDLSRPWTDQADAIKRTFEAYQQIALGDLVPRPRAHRKNWLRYLRVIDGREAGASWSELADVAAANGDSVPTPQNAKQVWEAARELMFNWPT